jgi:YbgC/YbaW family acyl-CoA thioester hydrolase
MAAAFAREQFVHWPDADAAGIVWFGHFLRYLEEAEEEMFRALGHDRQHLLDALGVWMPRTHFHVGFRSPARLNDRLEIRLEVASLTARRLTYAFSIHQKDTGAVVCEGQYRIACVDSTTFKPRAFPDEVGALLAPFTRHGPSSGASTEAGPRDAA